MRGFRKGITLGSRTFRSAFEVAGGWGGTRGNMVLAQEEIWWVVCSIIVSLQSSLELELGVRSLNFKFGY